MGELIILIMVMVYMGMYVCVYISKLIKLCLLNMCNLLHADYTLIKLLEKNKTNN